MVRTQIENRVEAREGWPCGPACLSEDSGVLQGECWQECEMEGHEGCYPGANGVEGEGRMEPKESPKSAPPTS